jgi:pilus assembly protein CpaE
MSVAEEFLEEPTLQLGNAECVAFVDDNQTHGVVASVCGQFFADPIVRAGNSKDALQFFSEASPPRVLIVDIAEGDDPVTTMLSLVTAFPPETRLIGIGHVNDIGLYRELTEAGIVDYLVKPISEKVLSAALSRAEELPELGDGEAAETPRIAVVGTRGGVGASSIAVNLAWLIAEERKLKTALVDLDLWFGTVALALDIEPTRGLREALENPARIDSLFVSSATAKLTDHLSVMATEETIAGEVALDPGASEILLEALGRANDVIMVDLPRTAFRMRHHVLQASTAAVLVTEMDLPSLRDSIRLLGAIEEANSEIPVYVIANRAGSKKQAMPAAEFKKAMGRKIDYIVPEDPKAFIDAANNGKPLVAAAPNSKAAKVLRQVAAQLTLGRHGDKKTAKRSWRSLLKRG